MSKAGDLEFDDTVRAGWTASQPAAGHPDEVTWRAFLEGSLDAEAREETLDHVSACPRCAGVFKAARTAALAEVPSALPQRARAIRLMPQLATLAATIAVAAIAISVLRTGGGSAPGPDTPEARPAPIAPSVPAAPPARLRIDKPAVVINSEQLLVTRSNRNEAAYIQALATALEPYQRDEFGEAARRLAPIAESRPDAFEPAFYLGASLLLDGKPQEAVPVLERALKLASPVRREEATRFLTLARAAATQP